MMQKRLVMQVLTVVPFLAWAAENILSSEYRCILHQNYRQICFHFEIADEPETRNFGLMKREYLAPRHGMLFDFEQAQAIGMWMKNTLIPLDMVFLDENRNIVFIHRHAEPHSLEIIRPPMPIRYTLELNAGEVDEYGLELGGRLLREAIDR